MEGCLRVASDTRKVFASETQQRLFEGAVSISAITLTRGGKSPYLFVIFLKLKYDSSTPMKFSLFQSSSSLPKAFHLRSCLALRTQSQAPSLALRRHSSMNASGRG